jgi:hypothetical protein
MRIQRSWRGSATTPRFSPNRSRIIGSVDVCGRLAPSSPRTFGRRKSVIHSKRRFRTRWSTAIAKQRAVSFPSAATAETRFEQCLYRCFSLDWHRTSATGATIQWPDFAPCTSWAACTQANFDMDYGSQCEPRILSKVGSVIMFAGFKVD